MSDEPSITKDKDLLERLNALEARVTHLSTTLERQRGEDSVCLLCFSGDWDKLFAAFTLANGALSLGQEVHMFFTFWAVSALREPGKKEKARKNIIQKMLQGLLPGSSKGLPLSRLDFSGLSRLMLGSLMKEKGVDSLESLMEQARELGAHFYVCNTSTTLFGMECSDLLEGDEIKACGAATFLSLALKSRCVFFI